MIKKTIVFLLVCWLFNLNSQTPNWAPFGTGTDPVGEVDRLFYDSVTNTLYAGGQFNYMGGKRCRAAARWNGTEWDSLGKGLDYDQGTFSGMVNEILRYKGKIYYFGNFGMAGDNYCSAMATWNGTTWDQMTTSANGIIYGADVYQDTLYICGNFTQIATSTGTVFSNFAAKFDGTNWYPLSFPYTNAGGMHDIRAFKNKVYATGVWYANGYSLTAEWDYANGWKPSFGVQGTTSKYLFGLERIDTLLYFFGRFSHISTCYSPGIAAWSGTKLYSLGEGTGPNNFWIQNVKKVSGKIYALGGFQDFSNITSPFIFDPNRVTGIAEYDGTKWCIYDDLLDNIPLDIVDYNGDKILAGSFWMINATDSVKKIAKWIGGNYTYGCNNVAIGVNELSNNGSQIKIYPNPVSNTLHIESEQYFEAGTEIEIINTLGQTVLKHGFNSVIDLTGLSSGYYTLKVISPNNPVLISKLIKD
jgi:hypothetical protein